MRRRSTTTGREEEIGTPEEGKTRQAGTARVAAALMDCCRHWDTHKVRKTGRTKTTTRVARGRRKTKEGVAYLARHSGLIG